MDITDGDDTPTPRTAQLAEASRDLLEAYVTREPIAPLRERIEGLTLGEAYVIQQLQEEQALAEGRTVIGRKIGLTSLAMQRQLGVDSPDFGFFTSDVVYYDDDVVPVAHFISPKVEPEFGFYLGRDLSGDVSVEEAVEAIASVHAAIEIIDSRIKDWNIRLVDTVADNASFAAVAVSREPLDLTKDDLATARCALLIDGEEVGSGTGADVMGHPAAPLAWLAKTLSERGVHLKEGDLVIPGSFCAAHPVEAGSRASADFGQAGSLTITFGEAGTEKEMAR
ncbi:2-keto-4-pentenoate hydratase [Bowdeniella nasicola]|uniref:2-keto-4-pentenoate hydratase n=1 Tax=Bowdeniella nasicola TaxID=208480 RepID=UPI000A631412|nr:fumarylacetoacetate hydrolase family protein [Bowdeniella nasicola]